MIYVILYLLSATFTAALFSRIAKIYDMPTMQYWLETIGLTGAALTFGTLLVYLEVR